MAIHVGNWTIEKCNTIGTGDLFLVGTEQSFVRWRDSVPQGQVYYVIEEGVNRESGVGTFNGVNTITRDTVHATLVNGTYNDNNPTPLHLTGAAVVACSFTKDSYDVIDNRPQ